MTEKRNNLYLKLYKVFGKRIAYKLTVLVIR